MPYGQPYTEEQRSARHKTIYGEESEPPAERIGWNAPYADRGGRPFGIPLTDDERRMQHKMMYGEESEPPAERIGWNAPGAYRWGRPFGIPMTDDERRMRHKMLYGVESEPPAERIGRNPMLDGSEGYYPVIIGGTDGATKVVYVSQGEIPDIEETLPAPIVIGAIAVAKWIVAHKMVAVALVAGATLLYGGLKATQFAYEKIKRRGLPPFQLIVGAPKPEEMDDPEATYALGVVGAVPGRKTMIKFGKGKYWGAADEVFREGYGDFMVEVTGRELAEAAAKRKFLTGKIPGLKESGDVTISMYAQEERKPLMADLTTPIAPVKIHIPGMVEKALGEVPCFTPPRSVSPESAAMGFDAGKSYYIKSAIPFLCCLPGMPYTPGMWVPPMCVISETM